MSKPFVPSFALALATVAIASSVSYGQLSYDESVDGDLSGAFGSPTLLSLDDGANAIFGTLGDNGNSGATNGRDADYFTFTLASNQSADSLNIVRDGFGSGFAGYIDAGFFTGQGAGDILGNGGLFDASGISDTDIPSTLGPGTHSFWLQETGDAAVNYTFSVNVTSAVPEPSGLTALVISGAVGLLRRRQ